MTDLSTKRILVTGGRGFIGRSLVDLLVNHRSVPENQIIIPDSKRDDLRIYENCERLIKENTIDIVIHLAALIGGVGYSSTHPATQYYNNILMDLQITEAAKNCGVEKIVLVSSSCAYPKETKYPLREEYLWDGIPQETNLAYGIAKRLMTVQAPAYREEFGLNAVVVIPNNAYGPHDNFHPEHSHVIPSLIRRCLSGEDPLVVWGDGTPTRDFLYVKDFAEGVILAAERLDGDEYVNIGSGTETPIHELVSLVQKLTGQRAGHLRQDKTEWPSATQRRYLQSETSYRL
jgi:GDP-L-fucose synthase